MRKQGTKIQGGRDKRTNRRDNKEASKQKDRVDERQGGREMMGTKDELMGDGGCVRQGSLVV